MRSAILSQTKPLWAAPVIKSPLYLVVVVFAVGGFTLMSLSVKASIRFMPLPFDWFTAYADVFPGNPRSAIHARGFSCPASAYGAYRASQETCFLQLKEGVFSAITVLVSEESVLQISFAMRNDKLTMGDLAALLGNPEIQEQNQVMSFWWPDEGAIASGRRRAGQTPLFLPISSVYIIDGHSRLCACPASS